VHLLQQQRITKQAHNNLKLTCDRTDNKPKESASESAMETRRGANTTREKSRAKARKLTKQKKHDVSALFATRKDHKTIQL
jgi:hypothetical protein